MRQPGKTGQTAAEYTPAWGFVGAIVRRNVTASGSPRTCPYRRSRKPGGAGARRPEAAFSYPGPPSIFFPAGRMRPSPGTPSWVPSTRKGTQSSFDQGVRWSRPGSRPKILTHPAFVWVQGGKIARSCRAFLLLTMPRKRCWAESGSGSGFSDRFAPENEFWRLSPKIIPTRKSEGPKFFDLQPQSIFIQRDARPSGPSGRSCLMHLTKSLNTQHTVPFGLLTDAERWRKREYPSGIGSNVGNRHNSGG